MILKQETKQDKAETKRDTTETKPKKSSIKKKPKQTLTNKGNNKITELRTILQRESQNS